MRPRFKLPLAAALMSAAVVPMPNWTLAQPQPRQILRPDLVVGSLEVGPGNLDSRSARP